MDTKVIEGVGFGIHGFEDDYIILLEKTGDCAHSFGASRLVPLESRVAWTHYEALTNGFGQKEYSAEELKRYESEKMPRATRIKITVETEVLSPEETQSLLDAVKRKNQENNEE